MKKLKIYNQKEYVSLPIGEYYKKEDVEKALIELRKEIIEIKLMLDSLN